MGRRVWVIAKKDQIEQSDIDNAVLNGCPEIANGIPSALEGVISPSQLPYTYEEPNPPKPESPRDLSKEIDEIKIKLADHEDRLKKDISGHMR